MNVEMTGRNGGCGGWTAVKRRQPSLMMKPENPQSLYPSHRSHPSFLHALIKPPGHWPGSNLIKANQSQSTCRAVGLAEADQTQSTCRAVLPRRSLAKAGGLAKAEVKTGCQQGLIGPEGGPNRQFLPLPVPGWTLNLEPLSAVASAAD